MREVFGTFRTVVFFILGIVSTILIDAIIKPLLPVYEELRATLDQRPIFFLLLGAALGLILAYIGHKSTSQLIGELKSASNLQLARIVELERTLTEERRSKGVDPLTGLPNQYRFEVELDEIIEKRGQGTKLTLIYLDLFGLKIVNDTQGDEFGSRYIQSCVKVISDAMYKREKMFRQCATAAFLPGSAEIYRSREGGG